MNSPLTSIFKGPRVIVSVTVSTTPYTLDESSSEALSVDATAGTITINLPLISAVPGRSFTIRKIDASANTVIIDAAGSDLIEGAGTLTLTDQWESVTIDNDGTQWHRTSTNAASGGGGAIPGTAEGEVLFVNTSLEPVGDTVFKWDNTNKRLGVGTTTPTQTLDIVGNVIFTNTGGAVPSLNVVQTNSPDSGIQAVVNASINGNSAVGIYADVEISSSYDSGQGIGIEGDVYHSGSGTLSAVTGIAGYFEKTGSGSITQARVLSALGPFIDNGGGGAVTELIGVFIEPMTGGATNYAIKYENGGANSFVVNEDGWVGIGNETPSAPLSITRSAIASGDLFVELLDSSAPTGYFQILESTSIAGDFIPLINSKAVGAGTNRTGLGIFAEPGNDGATNAAIVIDGRFAGGALTTSPILNIRNNTSITGTFAANGNLTITGGYTGTTGTFTGAVSVSGNLTVDTNTLVVDATNNRIGIGTASPARTVEITQSAGGSLVSIQNTLTTASTQQLWIDSGGTVRMTIGNGNSGTAAPLTSSNFIKFHSQDLKFLDVSNNVLAQFTHATGDFFVDTNTFYVDAANNRVGIGTATPSAPLSIVRSAAGGDLFLEITDSSAAGGFLRIQDGTGVSGHFVPSIYGKTVGTGGNRSGLGLSGEPGVDNATSAAVTIHGSLNSGNLTTSPIVSFHNNSTTPVASVSPLGGWIGTTGLFTGNLTVDSPTFFVDSTNHRVGVGTVSPGDAFTVHYATGRAKVRSTSTSGFSQWSAYDSSDTSRLALGHGNSATASPYTSSNYIFNNGVDFKFINASNAVQMSITHSTGDIAFDTNTLYVDAANNRVGVGTATPARPFEVVHTLPTGTARGAQFSITGAGSAVGSKVGTYADLLAGYTGVSATYALVGNNASAATATGLSDNNANFGVGGFASATTTGHTVGVFGSASGGNLSVGMYGQAFIAKNSAVNVAVLGQALNTGTTPTQIGGYFLLSGPAGTHPGNFTSAALITDNGTTTSPIFLARDNGTAVFTIADGGAITATGTLSVAGISDTGGLTVNGNTTLGDASGDTLTINGTTVSIPNNLNFDANTLFLDATNNRVGVGTATPGFTLDVTKTNIQTAINADIPQPGTGSTAGIQTHVGQTTTDAGITNLCALFAYSDTSGTGNRADGLAIEGDVYHDADGIMATATGVAGYVLNSGDGDITTAISFHAITPDNTGTGAIDEAIGVLIDEMEAGTVSYAIKYDHATAPLYVMGNGDLQTGAGRKKEVDLITANTTVDSTYHIVSIDATGGNVTVTLPSAATEGREFVFKRIDNSGNTVSITRAGADTIEGATSVSLATQWAKTTLIADGITTWLVI